MLAYTLTISINKIPHNEHGEKKMAESGSKKRVSKKAEVADIADTAEKIVRSKAAELKEKAADLKEFVTDKAQDLTEDVKKYSAQGTKKVAETVKKQPLKAVGVAAAVGAVLGFLFRRRKK